jgi:hypothetical protein
MASWQGKHVRLVGLSSAELNGAQGVAGQLDADSGRVCVRLTAPSAAVKAHPAGVKARTAARAHALQRPIRAAAQCTAR